MNTIIDTNQVAEDILKLRRVSSDMADTIAKLTKQIDDADSFLACLRSAPFLSKNDHADSMQHLAQRIRRIRELKNMMEIGSFSIRADQFTQRAWESLP